MAIQLKADEMLEAMCYEPEKFPELGMFTRMLEGLAKEIANILAKRLGIVHGKGVLEPGFAGLCVPFWAKRKNQPIPDHIMGLDEGGEEDWGTRREWRAYIAEYAAASLAREKQAKKGTKRGKRNHAKKAH